MEKYISNTKYHCGIDLHKNMSYICVMDTAGKIYLHKKIKNNDFSYMKECLSEFLPDLTIACETTFNWYILADFCEDENIPFALGHALYMKSIHGGKAKNDKIDSEKITDLLRSNLLPKAYACPKGFRAHRDFLRRRISLVQKRAGILTYLSSFESQNQLEPNKNRGNRFIGDVDTLLAQQNFSNKAMERNYLMNFRLLKMFNEELQEVDKDLRKYTMDSHFREDFELVKTMPGVGDILGMVLVYETHDIHRFKSPGKYASYSRVIKCKKESAGKNYGFSGQKIGNPHLKWAFGQIAILAKKNPVTKLFSDDLVKRYGKRKARAVFMHKICRAIYFMLLRKEPFDPINFFGRQQYERLSKKVH